MPSTAFTWPIVFITRRPAGDGKVLLEVAAPAAEVRFAHASCSLQQSAVWSPVPTANDDGYEAPRSAPPRKGQRAVKRQPSRQFPQGGRLPLDGVQAFGPLFHGGHGLQQGLRVRDAPGG